MMQQVARATVVITNPDEFAVALEYVPAKNGRSAWFWPKAAASSRKRSSAKRAGTKFPSLKTSPWPRRSIARSKLAGPIPAKLYTAVAEVLAFIYRAQARMREEAAAQRRAERSQLTAAAARKGTVEVTHNGHCFQRARLRKKVWPRLVLPIAAVAIVFVMLVPVPAFLLDILLATSITLPYLVLLVRVANSSSRAIFRFSHSAPAAYAVPAVAQSGQHAAHSAPRQ